MTTKELGDLGEKLACEYLVENGFAILEKNHKIKFGEIDIIARKKFKFFTRQEKTIHFIEVKTLQISSSHFGVFPEDHVDFRKKYKLARLAQIWLEKYRYSQDHSYQIDVIGILIDEVTRNAKLHYYPNAVEAH